MQKFGLSDSLLDAAKAVLQGKQPEPVVEETPDEEQPQSLDEKKSLDNIYKISCLSVFLRILTLTCF